jgi:hypothetical protein
MLDIMKTVSLKSHCEERSDEAIPSKKRIAAPFGLAMTVRIFIPAVLVEWLIQNKERQEGSAEKT